MAARSNCVLLVLTASLAGCTVWQERVAESDYIPLPMLAPLRLAEPDPARPGAYRLAQTKVLVGTVGEFDPEAFAPQVKSILTWKTLPSLSASPLPLTLVTGLDRYHEKVGLKLEANAKLQSLGSLGFDGDAARELTLSKLLQVHTEALTPDSLPKFLGKFLKRPQAKETQTYFVITNALVGDLDEKINLGAKVSGKIASDKFPLTLALDGGKSVEIRGFGVALGVQGRLVDRQQLGVYLPPAGAPGIELAQGAQIPLGADRVNVDVKADACRFRWVGQTQMTAYSWNGTGWALGDQGWVPTAASEFLLAAFETSGLALHLQTRSVGGKTYVDFGGSYAITLRDLGYARLKTEARPKPAAAEKIDVAAWTTALGRDAEAESPLELHAELLGQKPDGPGDAAVRTYELHEIFVPFDAKHYDRVRVTRYDVRGQDGKRFPYKAFNQGSAGVIRGRVFGEGPGGRTELTPKANWLTTSQSELTIPANTTSLLIRSSSRHEILPGDWSGFHGGRHHPVDSLSWTVYFLPPLGGRGRFVLGEAKPDAPIVRAPTDAALPAWVAEFLAYELGPREEEAAAVAKQAGARFRTYSLQNVRTDAKQVWMIYSTGN